MYLQTIESAEWKRYNANTRDANVGDCVKRALTIAYGMDYDEVGKELNQIKRKVGAESYAYSVVYHRFVHGKGDKFVPIKNKLINPSTGDVILERPGGILVSDVCDLLPSGTYILDVGDPGKNYSSHLCTVVNGVLYDSWDSRSWKIYQFCVVANSDKEFYEFDYRKIFREDLPNAIIPYCSKLKSKQDPSGDTISELGLGGTFSLIDEYTCRYVVFLSFYKYPPQTSKYSDSRSYGHGLVAKLNPTMSPEQNISSLQKKLCQKIYDWVYNVMKDIRDAEASESFDWKSSSFYGADSRWYDEEKKLIMNLPEWCRKLITDVRISNPDEYGYNYRYELTMNPLPEDPNPERGEVSFRCDTLRELKSNLESYRETGARFGYDY